MNETTEMWKEHRQYVQDQKWKTMEKNRPILERDSRLESANFGMVFIYRKKGKNTVQYWPSSEMWMVSNTKERYYGSPAKFQIWLSQYDNG